MPCNERFPTQLPKKKKKPIKNAYCLHEFYGVVIVLVYGGLNIVLIVSVPCNEKLHTLQILQTFIWIDGHR